MQDNIPHTPWFIRPEPTPDELAVIENGMPMFYNADVEDARKILGGAVAEGVK